ncbi:MAG: DEAD/DEAH box helicase [Myxococcales bacterium]|nr:DEAD/DEAH box helicase [Myxococcales bacterium]HIK85683.1 DEAD/DEAH box helicase [Myxococcales bacterium]
MSSAQPQTIAESGFDRFEFDSLLIDGLEAAGFRDPRPIQADTIPACLEGRDVMGLAQTGTGKTAAFALPILQRLLEEPGKGPLALILAPTRELAIQIDAEIKLLAKFTKIETVTVFGGVSASSQIRTLRRRPEIVVGCPGRILDLLKQRQLDLSEVETLVLDEADHMFDMGFLPDIKRILAALPKDRQNLLFSATMPRAIRDLASGILDRPHVVELETVAPAERIEHALYPIPEGRKRDLLDRLLAEDDCRTAIVFTRTKHRAKRLALQLSKNGLRAVALQGNMSQGQRDRAMSGFRQGRFDILVATDIAARGLDVAGIDYVINFDPPSTPETYTHRIGRTGRSEESGKACTLVTREDSGWVRDTERVLGTPIPRKQLPGFEPEKLSTTGGGGQPNRSGSNRSRSRQTPRDTREGTRKTNSKGPAKSRRSPHKSSGDSKRPDGSSSRRRSSEGTSSRPSTGRRR